MTPRDRELLDIGNHAKTKIEQALHDAAQLCDSQFERWQMLNALQVNLIKRLADEMAQISPILASWPEDVRVFTAATFAVQMAIPQQSRPSTLTPETLQRSWLQMAKAIGKLEGAPRAANR